MQHAHLRTDSKPLKATHAEFTGRTRVTPSEKFANFSNSRQGGHLETYTPTTRQDNSLATMNQLRSASRGQSKKKSDKLKTVRYPGRIPPALQGAAAGEGQLDLSKITPEMMNKLSPQELKSLAGVLSKTSVVNMQMSSSFGEGRFPEPRPMNAAEYLMRQMARFEGGGKAATRLAAQAGENVEIPSSVAEKISDNLGTFLTELKGGSDGVMKGPQARKLAKFASALTKGRNGPEKLNQLLEKLGPAVNEAGLHSDDTGLVVGSLLAGFRKSGVQIKPNVVAGIAMDSLSLIPGMGKMAVVAIKAGLRTIGGSTFGRDREAETNQVKGNISTELVEARRKGDLAEQDEQRILHGIERGMNLNGY